MMVKVRLNDSVVAPFLVDTGASHVSMPAFLASRLGLDIGPSTPHRTVVTANGQISVPVVRLDSVQVGEARIEHLEAHVNPTMQVGLLGGTFFNNFIYQVDAAESVINLSPNDRVRGGLTENQWRSRFREIARPLAELDAHLSSGEFLDRSRQRQLEQRRAALAAELGSLEREANKLQVPHAWRQ